MYALPNAQGVDAQEANSDHSQRQNIFLRPNLLFCLVIHTSLANVDIKKKQQEAPTPQNTPIFSAHIDSSARPSVPVTEEDMETIQTPGTQPSSVSISILWRAQARLFTAFFHHHIIPPWNSLLRILSWRVRVGLRRC
ncbi:hypothetical protein BGX26_007690 [Mortierella sp. AD094]|nr:hypothetical protein BGX26_007690 [Mortierella sp. AD094]